MSGTIDASDSRLVSDLKSQGVLLRFAASEFIGTTRNGGVAVMCADGDVDIPDFHKKLTHRPHCLRLFGGPLLFARSFKGFREVFAVGLLENLRQGMTVKDTKTLYLYVHAPCGVAQAHGYGIVDQLKLVVEARNFFAGDNFFILEKIHPLFHVKRLNKGGQLEQNTYRIALDKVSAL